MEEERERERERERGREGEREKERERGGREGERMEKYKGKEPTVMTGRQGVENEPQNCLNKQEKGTRTTSDERG